MGLGNFVRDFVEGRKIELRLQWEFNKGIFNLKQRADVPKVRSMIEEARKFNTNRQPCVLNYISMKRYENDLREALGYRRH